MAAEKDIMTLMEHYDYSEVCEKQPVFYNSLKRFSKSNTMTFNIPKFVKAYEARRAKKKLSHRNIAAMAGQPNNYASLSRMVQFQETIPGTEFFLAVCSVLEIDPLKYLK